MNASAATRWLTIIGVGEDGLDGLSPAARRILEQARFIVGGARHLAVAKSCAAETMEWPSPFELGIEAIKARRGAPTCVLASGDPFLYGVGATLAAQHQFTRHDLPLAVEQGLKGQKAVAQVLLADRAGGIFPGYMRNYP